MKKKERLDLVRHLLQNHREMSLEEISRHCGVSLRTTYRDLHAIYHRADRAMDMVPRLTN